MHEPTPHDAAHPQTLALIRRLHKIAKANDDEFTYKVEIRNIRNRMRFVFECQERADDHVFVAGTGATLEEACANAAESIDAALLSWNYQPA